MEQAVYGILSKRKLQVIDNQDPDFVLQLKSMRALLADPAKCHNIQDTTRLIGAGSWGRARSRSPRREYDRYAPRQESSYRDRNSNRCRGDDQDRGRDNRDSRAQPAPQVPQALHTELFISQDRENHHEHRENFLKDVLEKPLANQPHRNCDPRVYSAWLEASKKANNERKQEAMKRLEEAKNWEDETQTRLEATKRREDACTKREESLKAREEQLRKLQEEFEAKQADLLVQLASVSIKPVSIPAPSTSDISMLDSSRISGLTSIVIEKSPSISNSLAFDLSVRLDVQGTSTGKDLIADDHHIGFGGDMDRDTDCEDNSDNDSDNYRQDNDSPEANPVPDQWNVATKGIPVTSTWGGDLATKYFTRLEHKPSTRRSILLDVDSKTRWMSDETLDFMAVRICHWNNALLAPVIGFIASSFVHQLTTKELSDEQIRLIRECPLPEGLTASQGIIFPVNDGNTHWAAVLFLKVYFSTYSDSLEFFERLPNDNAELNGANSQTFLPSVWI